MYQSLSKPAMYYFDESVYVDAAQALFEGKVENLEHPPLGKYFIGESRSLFTNKLIGSRFPGFVAGILVVLSLVVISRELFSKANSLTTLMPLFFASMDPFFLNLAKIALLDMMGLAFFLMAFYFLLLSRTNSLPRFAMSAVFSGLSIAVKWNFAIWVPAMYLVFSPKRSLKDCVAYCGLMICIYIVSFLSYFVRTDLSLAGFFELHAKMISFHREFQVENAFQSAWWTWPLFLKPLRLIFEMGSNEIRSIILVGNPWIHWILFPLALLVGFVQRNNRVFWKLLFLFSVGLLFWAILPRRGYSYYYLSIVPFTYLLIVSTLEKFFINRLYFLVTAIATSLCLLCFIPLVTFDWVLIDRLPPLYFLF